MIEVSSKDFSVVLQGPIMGKPNDDYENQLTLQCIESIRALLPQAEIIISTWKGEDVNHLDFDKITFNVDPGATSYNDTVNAKKYNNTNRQIVSTYAGILLAERKYVIKMRGDCHLKNTDFMTYLDRFPEHNNYKILDQRIITCTVFSKNPRKIPILYHVSDIFQVGLRSDMENLWNIPLQEEPQTTRYVNVSQKIWNDPYPSEGYRMRYAAEQYIWCTFCKKYNFDLSLRYFTDLPFKIIFLSELLLIDNFIIVEPKKLGLGLPPKMVRFENYRYLYSSAEWLKLYDSYCVKKETLLPKISMLLKVYYTSLRFTKKNVKSYLSNSFKK